MRVSASLRLLSCCCALASPAAFAQAGPPPQTGAAVQFVQGEASLRRGGAEQPLARGDALRAGDALATGAQGRAQLRLAGGALASLAPDTQVALAPAPLALDFLAGALRVAMPPGQGADRDFTLQTARAQVRVRGPSFSAGYNADGTVNIATEHDPIVVCTAGGCVSVTDDSAVRVRADTLVPARTNARATWR